MSNNLLIPCKEWDNFFIDVGRTLVVLGLALLRASFIISPVLMTALGIYFALSDAPEKTFFAFALTAVLLPLVTHKRL